MQRRRLDIDIRGCVLCFFVCVLLETVSDIYKRGSSILSRTTNTYRSNPSALELVDPTTVYLPDLSSQLSHSQRQFTSKAADTYTSSSCLYSNVEARSIRDVAGIPSSLSVVGPGIVTFLTATANSSMKRDSATSCSGAMAEVLRTSRGVTAPIGAAEMTTSEVSWTRPFTWPAVASGCTGLPRGVDWGTEVGALSLGGAMVKPSTEIGARRCPKFC